MSPNLHPDQVRRSEDKAARKTYVAPQLEVYGAVNELTHTIPLGSGANDITGPTFYVSAIP